MEKEFIPYEQALALKELGFESPYPIGGHQGGKVFYYEKDELYYDGRPMYSSDAHSGQLLAPLYQQAFRWFREKCNLHFEPYTVDMGAIEYSFKIRDLYSEKYVYDNFVGAGSSYSGTFNTYEEAELECLKKLIDLIYGKRI
jgi:hypothetical protein